MFAAAYSETHLAFWTIAVVAVSGVTCALLGCFLLLRRLSLLGDAIGHGILPGIAVAVLFTGRITSLALMIGAVVFGLLTAFLAQTLHSLGKVTEDASLGVVFTSLFALGVLLLTGFLPGVDVDPNCIFFGIVEGVPVDTFAFLGLDIPRVFPTMFLGLLLTLGCLLLLWKEFKLAAFDPGFAQASGFPPLILHYLLIGLVAAGIVTAFEAVGSILVLAMLVVPAATAHLLTDRLPWMLVLASLAAVTASAFGYLLASRHVFACNVAGMVAVVAGVQLGLAVLFAPKHGLIAGAWRRLALSHRIAAEEILASLYRSEEGTATTLEDDLTAHGISPWTRRQALSSLTWSGHIRREILGYRLTEAGRRRAEEIIRAHRLWESFLEREFQLPTDHLHAPASRMEHFLGPEVRRELASQLEQPAIDPHGRTIPPPAERGSDSRE